MPGTLLGNRLEWTAGLRRYDADSHLGGYVTLPAFNAFLPDFNQSDSFTTESNSGFLHGIFAVTDALSVTAGAQPRPFTPGQQRIPVPAEELIAYEIGVNTDLFNRRLRVNVAAGRSR